ncbi:MAG: hypothetical protein H0S80_01890 [Desulfovibrionaceae bacterium]|nr:hypothetical protein [Desulfovibrionaceae bacterium]
MQISEQTTPLYPPGTRSARSLVKTFSDNGMTLEPEKTEEEQRLESSTLTFQKELTPEEENRVLFLTNLLSQLMDMANGQPSDEQKSRIREIEKELEKITGVKRRSSLAAATKKMPGRKKDDEEENEGQDVDGIDPKEAVHARRSENTGNGENPGMQMLRRNADLFKIAASFNTSAG